MFTNSVKIQDAVRHFSFEFYGGLGVTLQERKALRIASIFDSFQPLSHSYVSVLAEYLPLPHRQTPDTSSIFAQTRLFHRKPRSQ